MPANISRVTVSSDREATVLSAALQPDSPRPSIQSNSEKGSYDGGKRLCTQDLLHRKDAVIDQLQAALQSSQRQVALLRGALRAKARSCHGRTANMSSDKTLAESGKLAQRDASDSRRLKQLQHDYRLLLDSKISKLQDRAEADAMRLLKTMRQRLAASAEESEAQARLLNGRLADLERAQMDWYVEKRLMQEAHVSLQQEHERLQGRLREQETLSAAVGLQAGSL